MSVGAQEPTVSPDNGTVQAQIADEQAVGVIEQYEWTAEPPTLTAEQLASLEYWTENTHLSGPVLDEAQQTFVTGPVPGTESDTKEDRIRSGAPMV